MRHLSSSPPSITPTQMTSQNHVTTQQNHVTSEQQHVTSPAASNVTSHADPLHSVAQHVPASHHSAAQQHVQHGTSQNVPPGHDSSAQSGHVTTQPGHVNTQQQLLSPGDFKCEGVQYMPQLKREASSEDEEEDNKRHCHEDYQTRWNCANIHTNTHAHTHIPISEHTNRQTNR